MACVVGEVFLLCETIFTIVQRGRWTIFSPALRHDTAMSLAMSLGSRQALAPTLRAPTRVATNRARAATRVVPRASALSERIVQDANAAFSIPGSVVFEEGKGGLPVCKLTHKNGGTAEVYIFGACVTSW